MTTTSTDHALVGAWNAHLRFRKGPRAGEQEPVLLTFHPDGVILHADEIRLDNGQIPRGIGEWTQEDGQFQYWFHVVLTDHADRPKNVVHIRARGTLDPDGQTFTAAGTGEVYDGGPEPLVTHHVDVRASRAGAP